MIWLADTSIVEAHFCANTHTESSEMQVMYGRHSVAKVEGERAHPHISQDPKVLFPKQHVGHHDPVSNTVDYGPILVRPAGYVA